MLHAIDVAPGQLCLFPFVCFDDLVLVDVLEYMRGVHEYTDRTCRRTTVSGHENREQNNAIKMVLTK